MNDSAQNEVGNAIFADSRQTPVTIATSRERLRKEGGIDHARPYATRPENLMKIGPLHSEIIGRQWDC